MTATVVVAHRPHQWLVASLASVVDQCDELIVVDNGSKEEAVGRAAREYATDVVRLETNIGFAGGVVAGLAKATSELIGVLNDDAIAESDWLQAAAKTLADESYAAVGPKILVARTYGRLLLDDTSHTIGADPRPLGRCVFTATAGEADVLDRLVGTGIHVLEQRILDGSLVRWRWTSGGTDPVFLPLDPDVDATAVLINGEPVEVGVPITLVNSAGTFLTRRGFAGDIGYLAPDLGQFDVPDDRFGVSGAALVTTQRVLRKIGSFAENFFAYYEDLDWSWRARLAGYRIGYDPSATVRHVGGATSGGPEDPRVRDLAARNRLLTLARNAPLTVLFDNLRHGNSRFRPVGFERSVVRRLVPALLRERRMLAKGWARPPAQVWEEWAGVNEHWDDTGVLPRAEADN